MRLPADPSEIAKTVKGKDEFIRRRFSIKKEALEKLGYTAGCPECRAAKRGTAAATHTEDCRKRIGEKLKKVGDDERLERETAMPFEYLEEEENKERKAEEQRRKEEEGNNKDTGLKKEEHRRQAGRERTQ